MHYRYFLLITACYHWSTFASWYFWLPLYLVVDGLKLIMALLAWEEVRLPTLNKIFILAHEITMEDFRIVRQAFVVSWEDPVTKETESTTFVRWKDAYHMFRFFASFLRYDYVSLYYDPFTRHQVPVVRVVRNFFDYPDAVSWYSSKWMPLEGRSA